MIEPPKNHQTDVVFVFSLLSPGSTCFACSGCFYDNEINESVVKGNNVFFSFTELITVD